MFEQIFDIYEIKKHPEYSIILGVVFSLIAFFTSWLIFNSQPHFIGFSTILFIVVLALIPVNKLLGYEERLETRVDLSFFAKHKVVIDFFIYFFIGVFLTLFVTSLAAPNMVFSYDDLVKPTTSGIKLPTGKILPAIEPPLFDQIVSIFWNNFSVMMIAFILSFFYGAGALFLIVLNSSVFASALASVVRYKAPVALGFLGNYVYLLCNFGVMLYHTVPEVGAYLIAAIAGGVLSKGVLKEGVFSSNFRQVLKESFILLLLSVIILIFGAIIEMVVSKSLFRSNACSNYPSIIIFISLIIVAGLIFLEWYRKRMHKDIVDVV